MASPAKQRQRRIVAACIFLAAALALSWLVLGRLLAAPQAIAPKQALAAALAAGDWLVRTQRDDGAYTYTYDPASNQASQDGYSFVRHAGVTWSLLDLHKRTRRPAYLGCATRGLSRMERQIRRQGDVAYVVSRNSAPLGGAALAIVAYLELENQTPRQRETVAALGEMILRCQREDGSFRSHYPVKPPLRTKEIRSVYYPGEALLALTRLHKRTGEAKWLDAARGAARYLATRRDRDFGFTEPPPDHWYVIAAAELVPLVRRRAAESGRAPAERTRLEADGRDIADYAFKVADVIVANQVTAARAKHPDHVGGPDNYDPPRAAPAATRGEALVAACRLADALGRPRDRYLAALQGYAQFILRLQYRRATVAGLAAPDRALGAFAASPADPSTRMDYQQHGISCMLGLEALTGGTP